MRYNKSDQQTVQNFADKKEMLRNLKTYFGNPLGRIKCKNGFVVIESRMNFKESEQKRK